MNDKETEWEYRHLRDKDLTCLTKDFASCDTENSEDVAHDLDLLYGVHHNNLSTNHFLIRKKGEQKWEWWQVTRELKVQATMRELDVLAEN